MSDQFISVITDEAMSRICFDGGWNLSPWKFFISETDVLEGWTDSQIFNEDGSVKQEVYDFLKQKTTMEMQQDYNAGNVWFNNKFSSISKASQTSLTHHINIPGDIEISGSSKSIKTIYFLYRDNYDRDFMYALARCNETLTFETGITQSFFFNFTVTNKQAQDLTEFVLNYSCAHDVADHNNAMESNIHSFLVARDGSRTITDVLTYSNDLAFTQDYQLVNKKYVDQMVAQNVGSIMETEVCPPGTLMWWPSLTPPQGWLVRDGAEYKISEHPKLYAVLGKKYGGTATTFKVPDDRGLFIRGYQNGLSAAFGEVQESAAPNIYGDAQFTQEWETWGKYPYSGCFRLVKRGGNGTQGGAGSFDIVEFNASLCSPVYGRDNTTEIRPKNRNYLPIIKDDYS